MHYPIIRRAAACLGFAAIVAATAVGCGSSSSSGSATSSTSTPASSSAAAAAPAPGGANSSDPTVQAVTNAYTTFFNPKAPAAARIDLLQHGKQIAAQSTNPMAANTSATVANVQVTDPTDATVTYSILMSGNPALPNQTGQAVLENGQWKVATTTFCALLAMQGGAPPVCTAH